MNKILILIMFVPLTLLSQTEKNYEIVAMQLSNTRLIQIQFPTKNILQYQKEVPFTLAKDTNQLSKILREKNRNVVSSTGSGWQPEKANFNLEIQPIINQITSNSSCVKSDISNLSQNLNSDIILNGSDLHEEQIDNLIECLSHE
jgi:hypothetical protein